MSLRINTNIAAMNVLRNLGVTDEAIGRSIERLSTGLRINRGADDPAGLIISENLRAQLRSIDQAVRNAQDAINMVKSGEAALSEISTLLRNARNLAVHALNRGVVDEAQLRADQQQILSTVQSLDRIADNTRFSGKKLFDGTAGVTASVVNSTDVASIYIGSTFGGANVVSGSITAALVSSATRADTTLTQAYASLESTVSAGTIVLNGFTITSDGTETLQSIITKVNDLSGQTGVTAQAYTANGSSVVQLVQENYGSRYEISLYDTSNLLMSSATVTTATGSDAVATVTLLTSDGATSVTFTGGRGLNDSGLRLTDSLNNIFILTETGNTSLSTTGELVGALSAGSVSFQVGANAGEQVRVSLADTHARNLGTTAVAGKSFADIDLTSETGADEALSIIDAAIEQISSLRGDLGSFQRDVLESNVRWLGTARENLSATESTIRDADLAAEITEFTKLQILSQSGISVLAQANQAPQAILQLLS
jgi:flagellin